MARAPRKSLAAGESGSHPPPGITQPSVPVLDVEARWPRDGRVRAVIDAVLPNVDGGRFPLKSIAGEPFDVTAHCFTDGHDRLRVQLHVARQGDHAAHIEMTLQSNDVWTGRFTPRLPGRYRYSVVAWVDHFDSWRQELIRREERADIVVALRVGADLADAAAGRSSGLDAKLLAAWAEAMRLAADEDTQETDDLKTLALDPARAAVAARYPDTSLSDRTSFELVVDRKRAEFSSWYELFPRSAGPEGKHGTLADVQAHLPRLAAMGFNVLYFPPIHPIGRINRKGKNNTLRAMPDDVGSPWAIGAEEGGHKEILAQLGTHEDFRRLLHDAADLGIEIAMDLAFQCAPDHPYVSQHPDWFRHRPDGSVQYAENPPKKYQDIYPFDFESNDWRALWEELKSVVSFWVEQGVTIFRVDNPHTKSFGFWEWLIGEVKREHPEVLFLAEAFTRPKVMHRLAKLGFSQSYTYFTWRNSKQELTDYFTELTKGPGKFYFRPNVWPNTPDILPESLQSGLRQMFAARLVLATTLCGNYGIYGPTFELMESAPREAGSEEYRDSEKYQLRQWSLDRHGSLRSLIERMNQIRAENAALQSDKSLEFCRIDNDEMIAYMKSDAQSGNSILTVVNLDPYHVQSGWVELPSSVLDFASGQPYQVHDLLSEQRFIWRGTRNYIQLDPSRAPAHVFRLRKRVRSEHDFDYYQ